MELTQEAFAALVARALDELPVWVRERMDNVAVLVAPWPTRDQLRAARLRGRGTLLGLYEGVPLTRRGRGYTLQPPDRITLFQRPLEHLARDEAELIALVQRTVIHEIGHHFGLEEKDLNRLGI
ncbi:MAG: metallopeptidase family protein [Chloroflexi bacterium]|nr:metallopeptidase family protein [Chloroflexota bacterium]